MARKHGWWMSALALSLAWVFAPPADAKNTLNCTVLDETDKPIGKQEFILTSSSGKEFKKKTNDQGEAKFGGLDDGTYTLSGKIDGYIAPNSAPIELSGNAEKPFKYMIMTVAGANAKLQEISQLSQQKKFTEAAEKGKKLIEIMPGLAEAHNALAVAYAYAGDEAAIPEVKKAAELSPDKFQKNVTAVQLVVLNQEAEILKQKRDFAGAIKKYEAMLEVSPNDSTIYFNMAVTYGNASNFDEAIKAIDKAIALKPDDLDARKLKGTLQDKFLEQMNKKLEKK